MKKLIAAILVSLACMAMLAGCGGKAPEASGKQPTAEDVVKAVSGQLSFQDEMMMVDQGVLYNFYRLDEEKVAEMTMYASSSRSTAEEVTVIKVKDAADMQLAKDAIAERIEDQKVAYENYMPEEMTKINGAVTYANGNYVILVMADDTSSVEKTFNEQF